MTWELFSGKEIQDYPDNHQILEYINHGLTKCDVNLVTRSAISPNMAQLENNKRQLKRRESFQELVPILMCLDYSRIMRFKRQYYSLLSKIQITQYYRNDVSSLNLKVPGIETPKFGKSVRHTSLIYAIMEKKEVSIKKNVSSKSCSPGPYRLS